MDNTTNEMAEEEGDFLFLFQIGLDHTAPSGFNFGINFKRMKFDILFETPGRTGLTNKAILNITSLNIGYSF